MESLEHIFASHQGRLTDRWAHYIPIYERHFAKFRGTECRIMEIGVNHGGGLQIWKRYFGDKARITGIDIDPRCREYEEDRITIDIIPQAELGSLPWGKFDVVIDDGSHIDKDQSASFNALWPHLKPGGVYLIEDCHYGYPLIEYPNVTPLIYRYPWVLVVEMPRRIVKGEPSRELNREEKEAYAQYLHTDLQSV
jgi:SAM-dependent methyltransferase